MRRLNHNFFEVPGVCEFHLAQVNLLTPDFAVSGMEQAALPCPTYIELAPSFEPSGPFR